MRNLILIVLMMSFTGSVYAQQDCELTHRYGNKFDMECDRRGGGIKSFPSMGPTARDWANRPTALQMMDQRRNKERLYELELYKAQTERMKVEQQRPALNRSYPSYRGGVVKEIPRNKDIDASWSNDDVPWSSSKSDETIYRNKLNNAAVGMIVKPKLEPTGLYSKPSNKSKRVDKADKKSRLTINEVKGEWLLVTTQSGTKGWVMNAWVK